MKKNSLTASGLSLSQAQSISNLCNQRAIEINNKLTVVNNYSKTIKVNGENHIMVVGKPLPTDVVELLKEKASLHATQAFLMENIKAKDLMLNEAKKANADTSSVKYPEAPKNIAPVVLPTVNEDWGWEQLTVGEIAKFLEAEAYASHIGQYIHNGGTLDSLRKELPNVSPTEWMVINDGQKSPVTVTVHHNSTDLLTLHEDLAKLHREYEQVVNYYKAKVKNLVTVENARIAKLNADAQNEAQKANNDANLEYQTAYKLASEEAKSILAEFEKQRQEKIKDIASLRINVDPRFQPVVDLFLKALPTE